MALLVVNLFVRTELEDRTLQKELNGYKEYTSQVRYRLIPGVW
jgi:protein-S-isoprenylcysteine O-methyltransferase Ste14